MTALLELAHASLCTAVSLRGCKAAHDDEDHAVTQEFIHCVPGDCEAGRAPASLRATEEIQMNPMDIQRSVSH